MSLQTSRQNFSRKLFAATTCDISDSSDINDSSDSSDISENTDQSDSKDNSNGRYQGQK